MEGHSGGNWGSTRGKLLRNALWPPDLVGRTPDQRVMHCWAQCHTGVNWGQPGVKLHMNALWLPNFGRKNPWLKWSALMGSKVMQGQLRSTRYQIAQEYPVETKFGRKNPWLKNNTLLGSKDMWGQLEVKWAYISRKIPKNGYFFLLKWPLNMGYGFEDQAADSRPNQIWGPSPRRTSMIQKQKSAVFFLTADFDIRGTVTQM